MHATVYTVQLSYTSHALLRYNDHCPCAVQTACAALYSCVCSDTYIPQVKMASRRSFSVRSLLTETPRSNRSRLSFFMKRGSRSTSGHRIKRLFKSEILDSSPKARRNLALGSQRSLQLVIGPLVAKEAEVFEEHVSITMSKNSRQCALFGKYVAIVQEKYPALSSRVISSPSIQQICWLEILSPLMGFFNDNNTIMSSDQLNIVYREYYSLVHSSL